MTWIKFKTIFKTMLCFAVGFVVLKSNIMQSLLSILFSYAQKGDLKVLELRDFPTKLGRDEKYNWKIFKHQNLSEYNNFAPALNQTEYEWYLDIISQFKRSCETFNVTYMISCGSAFGAYWYHGFQPWDDDFDVHVNSSQKQVFEAGLSWVPGYTLYTSNHSQWKFYSENIGVQTKYKWKWPFIDIFFFAENATHVYDVTKPNRSKDYYVRSEILPFQSGIFENMVLPVPNNMEAYLKKKKYLMQGSCRSSSYDHKKQTHKLSKTRIPCSKLFNVYPIVYRFEIEDIPYEELRLGNKTLYRLRRN